MKNSPDQRGVRHLIRNFSAWFARNKWAKTVFTILMIVIPLFFLGRSLAANWEALQNIELALDWGKMAVALLILTAAFGLYPLGMMVGLRGMGSRLNYRDAYFAYHSSQLAKYLPGRVWIIPGRAVVLQRYQVDPVLGGASALLDSYMLVVAGSIVFIPYLFLAEQSGLRNLGVFGLILTIPAVLLIFLPRLLNQIFSLGMKWLGRTAAAIKFSSVHLLMMLGVFLVFWMISGFGFYYLAGSITPLEFSQYPLFAGVMGFSWVVGFVSFLTPAGFGVREGTMSFLLASLIAAPLPALLSILARFWWSLAEFGSIGLAFLFFRKRSGSAELRNDSIE